MKKIAFIIVSLSLFLFIVYKIVFALHPAIVILNRSDKTIVVANFHLPQSRISMDNVLPNERSKIHYDLEQEAGELKYNIILSDSTNLEGNCGLIENYAFGKRTIIEVNKDYTITCNQ